MDVNFIKKRSLSILTALFFALTLTSCALFTGGPGQSTQSADTSAEGQTSLGKPVSVKWLPDNSHEDAVGLKAIWSPVEGADGYEYRIRLFADVLSTVHESGKTGINTASVYFQDNSDIRLDVRAYRIKKSLFGLRKENVYGEWASFTLSKGKVYEILGIK